MVIKPEWRNGIRRGLKILGSKDHVGSTPTSGTQVHFQRIGRIVTEISGEVSDGFEAVADAFSNNFKEFGEMGAAFCLYVEGESVVDVWGGVADVNSGRSWTRDTLQLHFSTTKGLAAMCAAILYERGELDYEKPVSHYWPEFAKGGKERITVSQCMNHQAGLPAVDAKLTLNDICEKEPVLRALEEQVPLWDPGSVNGYHALTFGWIVGEIIKRIDGRPIGEFFKQEIVDPLGVDSFIGLPESE